MQGILYFLFWESSLTVLSLALIRKSLFGKQSPNYLVVFVLSTKFLVTSTMMFLLTYFRMLQFLKPLTLVFFAIAFAILLRSSFLFNSSFRTKAETIEITRIVGPILVLLILFTIGFSPMIETDSIYVTTWLMEFISGRGDVLNFAWNYSPLWEMNYMPGLFLTNSWLILFLKNFEVVVLLFFLIKILVCKSTIKRVPSEIIPLVAISTPLLWLNAPTGLATLKNDQIYSAGVLMVALAVSEIYTRRKLEFNETLLFLMGSLFIAVKFSGPMLFCLGAFFILILWRIHRIKIDFNFRKSFPILILTLSAFVIYFLPYFYNLLTYGNPFYPIKFSFFDKVLPGTFDTQSTSIIANFSIRETSLAFFGFNAFPYSIVGLLFIPSLILSPLIVWNVSIRARRVRTGDTSEIVFPLIIVSWILIALYLMAPWSSGTRELPFIYLNKQDSLRYVLGVVLILTSIAMIMLERYFKSVVFVSLIGALVVLSNIITVVHRNNPTSHNFGVWISAVSGLILLNLYLGSIKTLIAKQKNVLSLASLLSAFVLVLNMNLNTFNDQFYSIHKHDVEGSISNFVLPSNPQADVTFIASGYCATGSNFRGINFVGNTNIEQLKNHMNRPEYLSICTRPWQTISEDSLQYISTLLQEYDYVLFKSTQNRLLFRAR